MAVNLQKILTAIKMIKSPYGSSSKDIIKYLSSNGGQVLKMSVLAGLKRLKQSGHLSISRGKYFVHDPQTRLQANIWVKRQGKKMKQLSVKVKNTEKRSSVPPRAVSMRAEGINIIARKTSTKNRKRRTPQLKQRRGPSRTQYTKRQTNLRKGMRKLDKSSRLRFDPKEPYIHRKPPVLHNNLPTERVENLKKLISQIDGLDVLRENPKKHLRKDIAVDRNENQGEKSIFEKQIASKFTGQTRFVYAACHISQDSTKENIISVFSEDLKIDKLKKCRYGFLDENVALAALIVALQEAHCKTGRVTKDNLVIMSSNVECLKHLENLNKPIEQFDGLKWRHDLMNDIQQKVKTILTKYNAVSFYLVNPNDNIAKDKFGSGLEPDPMDDYKLSYDDIKDMIKKEIQNIIDNSN